MIAELFQLWFLLLVPLTQAFFADTAVEKEVATASKNIPVSVILYLKEQAAFQQDPNYLQLYQDKQKDSEQFGDYVVEFLQRSAREQQELLVQTLEALPDVKRIRSLYVANAVVIDITSSEVLEEIRKLDVVERVESNKWFHVKLENDKQYDAFSGSYDPYLRLQADRRFAGYINDVAEESQEKADNNPEWNIEWIHATELWNESITGKDLIYGNADTGVNYLHESLVDNYLGRKVSKEGNITFDHNYAWFDGVKDSDVGKKFVNKRLEEPFDDNGHGTHTTSTAIGRKGVGVAPGAKWMACRNMINGVGSPETYLACLQFFLAPTDLQGKNPKKKLRPVAVGNSYGCPKSEGCAVHTFTKAVENLRAAGVFMSVSAGNEGPMCSTIGSPPGYEPSVISVGALGFKSNNIAFFSSKGPSYHLGKSKPIIKPDIAAPGSSVRAAFVSRMDPKATDKYASLSGTSMASPHVGGAVLLLVEACPCVARDVDMIQDILQSTATKLPSGFLKCGDDSKDDVPNNVFGHGGLNIFDAVAKCKKICKK